MDEAFSLEALWPALLECRRSLAGAADNVATWDFRRKAGGEWQFHALPDVLPSAIARDRILLSLDEDFPSGGRALGVAEIYFRLLQGMLRKQRRKELFITAHFAQSLDGRIATVAGDSQWIGNQADLLHAHRLRALHDAILVGANTLRRDRPRLNVRHVEGDNPSRFILAGRQTLNPWPLEDLSEEVETCILRGCQHEDADETDAPGCELETLPCDASGKLIEVETVLACLRQRGHRSLLIEGGSFTVSNFLARGTIDELQIHVAPIILGSGISSLRLPEIARLAEAPRFVPRHYDLEGERLYCLNPL